MSWARRCAKVAEYNRPRWKATVADDGALLDRLATDRPAMVQAQLSRAVSVFIFLIVLLGGLRYLVTVLRIADDARVAALTRKIILEAAALPEPSLSSDADAR